MLFPLAGKGGMIHGRPRFPRATIAHTIIAGSFTHDRRIFSLQRAFRIWLSLGMIAGVSFVLSVLIGGQSTSLADAMCIFRKSPCGTATDIVWSLRFPRAVAAFCCGALLALCGTLLQVLLRNPLADPFVLGISSGAALGAMLALLLGATVISMPVGALLGSLVTLSLLFHLGRRDFAAEGIDNEGPTRLVLIGAMLAAGFGALVSLVLTLAPDRSMRSMLFWLMGDLAGTTESTLALVVLLVCATAGVLLSRDLNLIARGEAFAWTLGVPVALRRRQIILVAAVASACAVAIGGSIGFVGLVVPHVLRLAIGNDQRVLVPAAVLAGGTLLLWADLLARTVAAPTQIPVGVITVCLGVPVFLAQLRRARGRSS